MAQRLEHAAAHHRDAGEDKAQADDAQAGHADGQQRVAGVKDAQQLGGEQLHDDHAHQHDAGGVGGGQLDGGQHPLGLAGTVVVAQNGHHAVVHAEHGHEHKALQLEVHAEEGHGGAGEVHQDAVHAQHHNAADGLHTDAGHAHAVNAADGGAVGAEALEAQLHFLIEAQVEPQIQPEAHALAQHSGNGGAGRAHGGQAEHTEDHDGVQNDVGDGAGHLAQHAVKGIAGGHQDLFQHQGDELGLAEHTDDEQVAGAVGDDFGVIGLRCVVEMAGHQAEHHKHQHADHVQEQTVGGGPVGLHVVLFAQGFAQQGVYAHAGAHAHGDHQGLDGEGHAHGGEGVLTHAGDEDAVHNVVKRLHQHAGHHGQRHTDQQLVDGHDAHLVFLPGCGSFGRRGGLYVLFRFVQGDSSVKRGGANGPKSLRAGSQPFV